jgi:hypothetical protein
VIDVSEPSAPVELGFFDTPDLALSVAVAGDYAYVSGLSLPPQGYDPTYLWVIDVSNPAIPVEMGRSQVASYEVTSVALSSGQVFVTGGAAGRYVFAECGGVLFHDGFESGDTSAWSVMVP